MNKFLPSIQEVYALLQAGKTDDALSKIKSWESFDTSLIGLDSFPPLFNLGMQLARAGINAHALIVLELAVVTNPSYLPAQYNLGLVHALSGNHESAIQYYDFALVIAPDDVDTLTNKAASLNDLGRYQEAVLISDQLMGLRVSSEASWMIRGIALSALGQWINALGAFDHVLAMKSRSVEAHVRRALVLDELSHTQEAIMAYERALLFDPRCVEALSNLGGLYRESRKFSKALAACESALKINIHFANAWINHGFTLADIGLHEKALESYEKAIAVDAHLSSAWVGKGFSHSALKQFDSAAAAFERVLAIDPGMDFLLGPLAHAKMQICDWSDYERLLAQLVDSLSKGLKVSPPFQIIGLVEDPKLIQAAARAWVLDQHPIVSSYPNLRQHPNPTGPIKLGYFSADLREHPVAQLIAGMIEAHDRTRFEIYAFSLGSKTSDSMRERLEKGFDHFIDIHEMSDEEVVALARKEGIDIAIDLTGLTGNSRPDIFAKRAAPIQINYLGFPSTMGASFMDYIIADEVLIPEAERDSYDEKILYMPHSFQVNDASKVISEKSFTKSEFGLPEDGFVFCAFSNGFKITPPVFATWMNILQAIPKSVIWLSIEDETARENLKQQAIAQGIASDRLIFAQRLPFLADHLARYLLADLFLDTMPYGAHTTASDALWAGLPVLTCIGRGYASRVAASLLHTLDLDDLISSDLKAYEQKAVTLAKTPEQLKSLKAKLGEQIKLSPLFNTRQFTKDLEKIYIDIYQKYQGDLLDHHPSSS